MFRHIHIAQFIVLTAIWNVSFKHLSFIDGADKMASVNRQTHLVLDSSKSEITDTMPVYLTPSLRHGLDTTISPCEDFDRYVNGGWRTKTQLPKDVKMLDVFSATSHQTKKLLTQIVDSAFHVHLTTTNANMRVVGQYYASCIAADSLDRSMRVSSMAGAEKHDTTRAARCTRLAILDLQDAVGQLFVQTVVPVATEGRVQQLLSNIRSAANRRIDNLSWLSLDAKTLAKDNLAKMTLRVAKPKTTIEYSGLVLTLVDVTANQRTIKEFLWQNQVSVEGRNNEPVWSQNQFTANALYHMNSIEVPAFMFQWPLFDPTTEDALSYAGVGMIIGHETYHGITEYTGAQANSDYERSAERLKVQYSNLPKIHGLAVNGTRTLNENLADLGGLLAAYDAWSEHAKTRAVPDIEGFTPDQRFFLYYARLWRSKPTRDYMSAHTNGVHPPHIARINGVLPNIPAFAKAFSCREGDPMAHSSTDRVTIW